ncbi:MAG: VOC family protein [Chlamydiota bacterium]
MSAQSLGLAWIVVNDLKKAVEFYTKVIGLKLMEINEEYGWAELEGQKGGGSRLGIAQMPTEDDSGIKPGQNAIVTFTVTNLDSSIAGMTEKGAKLVGAIQEVPGHVKMQMVCDIDGNHFQMVEVLHHVHSGCCSGH